MNNLKKIGLTALAGSLVASTAYAGALSVSGSAGHQSKSGSSGTASVQGNPTLIAMVLLFLDLVI